MKITIDKKEIQELLIKHVCVSGVPYGETPNDDYWVIIGGQKLHLSAPDYIEFDANIVGEK
jgi:hypothetical protein